MKLKVFAPYLPGIFLGAACVTAGILAGTCVFDYFKAIMHMPAE